MWSAAGAMPFNLWPETAMVAFTQLPARNLAKMTRLLVSDPDFDSESGSAIPELLSRVQIEFKRDEENMATNLLHYRDIVVKEHQIQELKVQFELPPEMTEANEEQCKSSRRVYPPTPARPSMETLAKLMEVSYTTDWSQTSYDDTSADSKLAEWLASFARDQTSSSFEDSILNKRRIIHRPSIRKASDPANKHSIPDLDTSPGQTPWRPHNQARSQRSSSGTRRRAVSDPVSPWYDNTHSSSSHPTSPSSGRRVHLQLSPIHIRAVSNPKGDIEKPVLPEDDKKAEAPCIPRFSFEIRANLPDVEDTPNLANLPSPTASSDALHPTPLQLDPSSPFVMQSPALDTFLSFSDNLEDVKPNMIQDLSVALGNALPDLSTVHAFNLSLQHASKSPFLIRTWKRMLGELTGRFPLSLGLPEQQPEVSAEQHQPMCGDPESGNVSQRSLPPTEPSTASRDEFSSVLRDSSDTQKISIDSGVNLTSKLRVSKTQADILLDREYAAYIRSSIDAKQEEVRMLNDLIAQRKQTIERMEKVLKIRALESLRND